MQVGSLAVLGGVFLAAFAGRVAVLAASPTESPQIVKEAASSRCIDGAFAEELRAQAAHLEQAEAALAEKKREAEVILKYVSERINELEKANEKMASLAETAMKKEAAGAGRVATLYEKMKPELAGGIIGGMAPSFAASLLLSMNSQSASSILGAIPPERAYAITVLMAAGA